MSRHYKLAAILPLAALLCSSPSVAGDENKQGETHLAKTLAGRVADKPVDCVSMHELKSSTIIDGTAIVYQAGSTLYVNRPRSGVESLDTDDILVANVPSSRLCRLDSVRLVNRTTRIYIGSVTLDQFVPYRRAPH